MPKVRQFDAASFRQLRHLFPNLLHFVRLMSLLKRRLTLPFEDFFVNRWIFRVPQQEGKLVSREIFVAKNLPVPAQDSLEFLFATLLYYISDNHSFHDA